MTVLSKSSDVSAATELMLSSSVLIYSLSESMVSSVKTGLSLSCISICSSTSSFSDGVHIVAGVKFLVPIYGFLSTIINAFGLSPEDKVRAKVNDRISNSNNVYSYAPNSEEIKNFNALVLHAT
jgi:hypothetical protein